jgi:hypothetical protein
MAQAPIPEDIRRFVLTSIPSVPHLEALLLLRAERERSWDVLQVARRLYISEKIAAGLLDDLCRSAMINRGDEPGLAYRYAPASEPLRATIDALAELYGRRLVDITNLIHSKLDRKAQQFADAFLWRKGE